MFGDGFSIVAGFGEAMIGGDGFVIGTLLDVTGGGALIGIPVQVAGSAVAIHGGVASALGYVHWMEANRKGGGKTGGKVSKDALAGGKKTIDDLRSELQELRSKPNKTPADKQAIDRATAKLKQAIERLRRSEEHARIGQH